jgi:hypothetical protein
MPPLSSSSNLAENCGGSLLQDRDNLLRELSALRLRKNFEGRWVAVAVWVDHGSLEQQQWWGGTL